MPFSDFVGNPEVVQRLREMLARERFPHAVILSGAQGSGKYTLALMLARAMNCLERPTARAEKSEEGTGSLFSIAAAAEEPSTDTLPDFCGRCSNCIRIAQSLDFDSRFAEAVEARENLRDADK